MLVIFACVYKLSKKKASSMSILVSMNNLRHKNLYDPITVKIVTCIDVKFENSKARNRMNKRKKIEVGIIEKDMEEKVALKDDNSIRMNEGNNETYAFDSKN